MSAAGGDAGGVDRVDGSGVGAGRVHVGEAWALPDEGHVQIVAHESGGQLAGVEVFVALKAQLGQGGDPAEARRDGPAEVVAVDEQMLEFRQPAEFGRDRPGQVVASEGQRLEFRERPEFGWDRPRQGVVCQGQDSQVRHRSEFRRYRAAQRVPVEVQPNYSPVELGLLIAEFSQLGRDGSAQPVVRQRELLDLSEPAELGGNAALQTVAVEVQHLQPRMVA